MNAVQIQLIPMALRVRATASSTHATVPIVSRPCLRACRLSACSLPSPSPIVHARPLCPRVQSETHILVSSNDGNEYRNVVLTATLCSCAAPPNHCGASCTIDDFIGTKVKLENPRIHLVVVRALRPSFMWHARCMATMIPHYPHEFKAAVDYWL